MRLYLPVTLVLVDLGVGSTRPIVVVPPLAHALGPLWPAPLGGHFPPPVQFGPGATTPDTPSASPLRSLASGLESVSDRVLQAERSARRRPGGGCAGTTEMDRSRKTRPLMCRGDGELSGT
jgi:hypothetical protein